MFEDSRGKATRVALSLTQLEAVERYFDYTVTQLKHYKRDVTEEEKEAIQMGVIAMIK